MFQTNEKAQKEIKFICLTFISKTIRSWLQGYLKAIVNNSHILFPHACSSSKGKNSLNYTILSQPLGLLLMLPFTLQHCTTTITDNYFRMSIRGNRGLNAEEGEEPSSKNETPDGVPGRSTLRKLHQQTKKAAKNWKKYDDHPTLIAPRPLEGDCFTAGKPSSSEICFSMSYRDMVM